MDDLFEDEKSKPQKELQLSEVEDNDLDDMLQLPMDEEKDVEDVNSTDDEYDLQKELEAKFDELFGSDDDEG